MNGDNAHLFERLKNGDVHALADMFSLHRERLLRIIRFRLDHRVSRRIGAEDILQDAYVNASKRMQHIVGNAGQSAFVWLRLIVCQTLVDIHRHHLNVEKRDANREVSLHNAVAHASQSWSFAAQLTGDYTVAGQAAIRNEILLQLQQAIAALHSIDREVLLLRHFEGLSNNEVAEELGIGATAASNRYIRAIARLKEILSKSLLPDL